MELNGKANLIPSDQSGDLAACCCTLNQPVLPRVHSAIPVVKTRIEATEPDRSVSCPQGNFRRGGGGVLRRPRPLQRRRSGGRGSERSSSGSKTTIIRRRLACRVGGTQRKENDDGNGQRDSVQIPGTFDRDSYGI